MKFEEFETSLKFTTPPAGLSPVLLALWHDARGDFDAAHEIAQSLHDAQGSRVHAYLHRKEGDLPNARYWYSRAGVEAESGSLAAEWTRLVREFS